MQHRRERSEAEPVECPVCGVGRRARGTRGEREVLPHRQVVVATGIVTDERELMAVRPAITREITAEHLRVTRMHRDEPRDQSQQCRLSRAVATREQQDLALSNVEIDAGECREAAEEADGGAETNDGLHRASLEVSEV